MLNRSAIFSRTPSYYSDMGPMELKRNNALRLHPYNRELFRARANRIVDLFPDEIVIQEKTISIIRREPLVTSIETLQVKDIGRVIYTNSLIFSGLHVLGKNPSHDLHIKGLKKVEGVKAKEIIEGLLLEVKGDIEVPAWLHQDERREQLAAAGRKPND